MLFEDAVILGAASDGVTYKPPCEDTKKSVQNLPFCIVERTVRTHFISNIASTNVEISFHLEDKAFLFFMILLCRVNK